MIDLTDGFTGELDSAVTRILTIPDLGLFFFTP